ncbi:unnamed protein product [Cylicocyclus nassatus]|uniref:Fungal lipase-type domain-containing protein n=1 Tax=Cylicocyclus nassatus TaxID=53992 RepID=A0AA36GRK2_CYLNA|nr:unnamed protein product [Cylicocyclus nassatus]
MFGLIATLSLVVVGAHSAVFSDDFAYNNMLPLAAAAYSDHPDACVRNHFNGQIYRFYKQHSEYEIWITGHSLGGALASLAASYLIDYAFRVIHANDGVPHVPPEKFGYRHHKQEVYYSGQDMLAGKGKMCNPGQCSDKINWLTYDFSNTHKCYYGKAFTLVVTLCLAASLNAVRLFDYNFVRNQMFPLAAAAYSDEPRGCILNRLGYNGTHGNLFFDHNLVQCDGFENDCYGFLATLTEQSAIVLSFRGTNYLSQLKNEVATSAAVVPMGSGEVSWYFYNAFSNVWGNDAKGVKGLERAFKNQIERHPKYEIWVTVHSLGGAMASLAAYHIAKTYNKISERINERIKLVTFGEPRTGNAAYAEDFNKKVEIYIIIYTACSNTRSALLCQYTMSVY